MEKLELNRNEQLYGPAPKCLNVIQKFNPEHAYRYLEGYYSSLLRSKLSEIYSFPEESIITSYGAEYIFRVIFDNLTTSESVLTHEFYYSYYSKYLEGRDVKLHLFKMLDNGKEFVFDIDDCLTQYQKLKPKVIVITSPNNPTGNSITPEGLHKVLRAVSEDTLVVLDEAYWGFNHDYNQTAFFDLIKQYSNLIILRSFSKLYGLAGLRIGFAFCGTGVKSILRYQEHYLGMSRLLEEVAIAALDSPKYYQEVSLNVAQDREKLIQAVNGLTHFSAYQSDSNFIVIKVDDSQKERLQKDLELEQVTISKFIAPNLMRVSLGLPEHNKRFIELLSSLDKL